MATTKFPRKTRVVVMGVSGSGKSTIAGEISKFLHCPFLEGDQFHPPENIHKMAVLKQPLTDEDRNGWLQALYRESTKILNEKDDIVVVACSALKHKYRLLLSGVIKTLNDTQHQEEPHGIKTIFIFPNGGYELIKQRMEQRQNHYMKPEMLKSQFETLESPAPSKTIDWENTSTYDVIEVSIQGSVEGMVSLAIQSLKQLAKN